MWMIVVESIKYKYNKVLSFDTIFISGFVFVWLENWKVGVEKI